MQHSVKLNSSRYPGRLKEITDPPPLLYYKGIWDSVLFENCLAVVGSRRMTTYGRQITEGLVAEIAAAGITIVSGFMYGVDATAHQAAIDAGGRTIAVMPCGIDIIHPEYQDVLYQEILENNGLIISELEAGSPPALWTYPRRNRIMAALSQATLVVEASLKSGSLITACLACRYQRQLFAVPGPLTSLVSQGTAQLIKEGAQIVTGAADILALYGQAPGQGSAGPASASPKLSRLERSIVEELERQPQEIDSLSRRLSYSAARMGSALSLMELRGLLREEQGKYYIA